MRAIELHKQLQQACVEIYGQREAAQIASIMLEELWRVTPTTLIIEPSREVQAEGLERVLRELSEARPMQYIVGGVDFYGYRFAVREGVLIPRPETEEIVARIIKESTSSVKIVDVGTGSGAIAITLAKEIENSSVTAIDISPKALEIARENASRLEATVQFIHGDALQGVEKYINGEVDIVVSNPPYIPQSEESEMRSNVTEYEPHLALFVEDSDPLIFYKAIAISALKILRKEGRLYFEIHEDFAQQIGDMLRYMGYKEVKIINDINDKERVACAVKR